MTGFNLLSRFRHFRRIMRGKSKSGCRRTGDQKNREGIMKRNLLPSTAVTGLLASLSAAPALAQSDTTTEDSADDGGISDIVVTASRRSENMQDVAITVQALGGEQLAERGITNFDQLLAELPQVHAGGRGPGQKTISIRGLSLSQVAIQTSALAGASPTVAL
jgi:iron complex outermembrane recepter protein